MQIFGENPFIVRQDVGSETHPTSEFNFKQANPNGFRQPLVSIRKIERIHFFIFKKPAVF
jgi:hypothetical protein